MDKNNSTYRIRRSTSNTRHNRNEHMLLNAKRARIKSDTEDLNLGYYSCPCTTDREGNKQGHILRCLRSVLLSI